jgi:hypothetical protein
MIYGYIRVSTDRQTVENQRFEINRFCEDKTMVVERWIEETIFADLRDYILHLIDRCLLAYETNKNATYSIDEKETYRLMIWRYSKNAAMFLTLCQMNPTKTNGMITIKSVGNRQTILEGKQEEINQYCDKLGKFINSKSKEI